MAEPTSSSAGAMLGWKLAGLAALIGTGVVGALIMAWVDPPKDKKTLFAQALCAAVASLVFGPSAVAVADHYLSFFDLSAGKPIDALTWGAPIFFIVGALSWGAFGMLVRLREIIKTRGADELARRFGPGPGSQ